LINHFTFSLFQFLRVRRAVNIVSSSAPPKSKIIANNVLFAESFPAEGNTSGNNTSSASCVPFGFSGVTTCSSTAAVVVVITAGAVVVVMTAGAVVVVTTAITVATGTVVVVSGTVVVVSGTVVVVTTGINVLVNVQL
jgi:hypothetical protein